MRIDSAGTIWQVNYFKNAEIGAEFHCNGNRWKKRSTKTAEIVKPESFAGKWFYFRQNDICETKYNKESI